VLAVVTYSQGPLAGTRPPRGPVDSPFVRRSHQSDDPHGDVSQSETDGSAENYSNSMRCPVIDEPEAEIAGEDNAVDLY
jgi:hypothetical protein